MTSIFQKESYYCFIEETGFLKPFRYTAQRDSRVIGIIQGYIQKDGGFLKSYLSRRAIINGGPWFTDDITASEQEELFEKSIRDLKNKVIYIEIRNFEDFSRFRNVFEKVGFLYEPHYNFIVDTENKEIVDLHMGKSRKRDVNNSLKSGVSVVNDPNEKDVVDFYAILENLYHKKVKTPLFPLSFFLKLWKTTFSKFILVKYNEEIVGGTVIVFDEETVYEWFACGKDGIYKNVFPSTVATYYGIMYAAENGFKHFDMMGAGAPSDGGYGVREFKAKFGGELVEFGRYKYICNKMLFELGKMGVNIMKKLK